MKKILALVVIGLFSCGGELTEYEDDSLAEQDLSSIVEKPSLSVCGTDVPGQVHCHSKVRLDSRASPSGLTPSDLRSAYKLAATYGRSPLVAIVDAYDNPKAESDLAVYRKQFGLPPCTTANGCFRKVNQNGKKSPLPKADTGWAQEIALDLDMVSAVCPECRILLVEATNPTIQDLGAAVNTAVKMGAVAVSNSYGGGVSSSDSQSDELYFNHPGVLITVSSGDSGYGVEYPAASKYVMAVGGTSLVKSSSNRGWAEKAWSGAGSGCASGTIKPTHQKDLGCTGRTVADVSAVSDPSTGVAVYASYGGSGGWLVFGGTSASAPIIAGIYAATGVAGKAVGWSYLNPKMFYDVKSGSNGTCGTGVGKYLCVSLKGYDGPTGLGTPNAELLH